MSRGLLLLLLFLLPGCRDTTAQRSPVPPDAGEPCTLVNLLDGSVDGAAELRNLFDCLNQLGSLDALASVIDDVEAAGHLDEVADSVNLILGIDGLEAVLDGADALPIEDLSALGVELIDSGAVEPILPAMAETIESGMIEAMLPFAASALGSVDLQGFDAAETLVPVIDTLIDSGTLAALAPALEEISLESLPQQLRPLLIQSASGLSDLQRLLIILQGTNQPLTCLGLPVADNLAELILELAADRTPADIQNLIPILEATLGLAGWFCSLPPEIEQHFAALDALANSGALDTLLPILKVFKDHERTGDLLTTLVMIADSGVIGTLEPIVVAAIDDGAFPAELPDLSGFLDLLDVMVSPRFGNDYETAPIASFLDLELPSVDVIVDLLGSGAVEAILPALHVSIQSGNASAVLPWFRQILDDGSVSEMAALLRGALDMMGT